MSNPKSQKMTKENYKEILDEIKLNHSQYDFYYYHHSYLSESDIEIYAFDINLIVNNKPHSGSIRKVWYNTTIK